MMEGGEAEPQQNGNGGAGCPSIKDTLAFEEAQNVSSINVKDSSRLKLLGSFRSQALDTSHLQNPATQDTSRSVLQSSRPLHGFSSNPPPFAPA